MQIMSDSQLLLQNLSWSDSFEDLPLDLCFHPQVFNMFVAAVNERLVVAARWTEHLQFQGSNPGSSAIDGYFRRYYGTIPGQGTFQFATEIVKINLQSHNILPINEVNNKSVMALGVPNYTFGQLEAKDVFMVLDKVNYPVPKNFNIKTYKFDLASDSGVNNWVWLQGVVGFLAFFFAKQNDLEVAALGQQENIASWRTVYDGTTENLSQLESKIKPHSFYAVEGKPLPAGYGEPDTYVPFTFRRRYPRTIVRLDDPGEQGQVARLIKGDTSIEIKNPSYDSNVFGSQEYIKVADPLYAEIKNNYFQLYIYDLDGYNESGDVTRNARGEETYPAWRLLNALEQQTIVSPDTVASNGWIERGDYFGPWIVEDLRLALNSFKFVLINKFADLLFGYSRSGYGSNEKAVTLERPAEIGDTFLHATSPELKVGRYVLTGGPNKIVEVGGAWFKVENPVLERIVSTIYVSDDFRVFVFQNAQPENYWGPPPIIYSGDLPLGGPQSGLYYPGFSVNDLNRTASYTPQKYAWFGSKVGSFNNVSGSSEQSTIICSLQKDMGEQIKTVHYFKDGYLGQAKPEIHEFWELAGVKNWQYQYDPEKMSALSYEADKVYCFITGTQTFPSPSNTGFPIWDFAIVEFEFEYRGD